MNLEQLKQITSNGKIFTIVFKKKDGDVRVMNARTGVTKHLKGGSQPYDAVEKNLFTVFEIGKGYKTIPIEGIMEIHANATIYK
jgi:hypothetical protein